VPHDLEVDVTRQEFDAAIAPLLDRSSECVLRALEAAKLSKEQIQRVILVGGTTYVPAVRQRLQEVLGKEVNLGNVDPDLAVSQGAALMAQILAGKGEVAKGITVSDVSRFGLGIEVLTLVGNQVMLVYEPMIYPNQKIPAVFQKKYSLVHPDQREVEIKLYQDPTGKAQLPEEAIDTHLCGHIKDIPPALYGQPHPIEVSFVYNADGRIEIEAEIPGIGKSCSIRYDVSGERMGEEQIAEAKKRIEQLFESSPLYKDYSDLISRAEGALGKAAGKPIEHELRAGLLALKNAIKEGNSSAAKEAEEQLLDALFRLEIGS
jgi:molecular chaperone DnaK